MQVSRAGAWRQLEWLIQVRGWALLIFGSITAQWSLRTGTFDNSLSRSQFCDERYSGFTTFYVTGLETSNTGPKPEVSKRRPVGQMWPNVAHHLFLNELWAKNHFYIFLNDWKKQVSSKKEYLRTHEIQIHYMNIYMDSYIFHYMKLKFPRPKVKCYWYKARTIHLPIVYGGFQLQQHRWATAT